MSRKLGTVALFVGAFALAIAALSKFYMYDRLAVVPTNYKTTSISSTQSGQDATYLDVAAGVKVVTGPLKSTQVVTGSPKLSKEASKDTGKDVAVWRSYTCTDKPTFDCQSGDTPLSGGDDLVAFDVHTGEAVKWKGTYSTIDGVKKDGYAFTGLYFKFPFETQKKSYQWWDSNLQKATTAKYEGTSTLDGLTVYDFKQTIPATKTGTIDVPGSLVGSDEATVTADMMYSNVRTFKVEPKTGVVIVGGENQDSYLAVDGVRKATTTEGSLQFTAANTKATVDDFKPKAMLLGLVKTGIPIGGAVLGIVLIGLGVFLRRGDGDGSAGAHTVGPRETAGV